MDFQLHPAKDHTSIRLHKAVDGAQAEITFEVAMSEFQAVLFMPATVSFLPRDGHPVFVAEGTMDSVQNFSDSPVSRRSGLRFPLSSQALAAIESLRNGKDLIMQVAVQGVVLGLQGFHDHRGFYAKFENILQKNEQVTIFGEMWTQRRRESRIREAISLEIPDPERNGDVPHHIATSLKTARTALSGNDQVTWTHAVIAVRMALESWEKSQGWNQQTLKPIANKKIRQRSRSEQLLLLRHMLLGFCHKAAHHSSQNDTDEGTWSREEAQMTVAAAMGLFAIRDAFPAHGDIAAKDTDGALSGIDEWLEDAMEKLKKENPAAWASILRTIHSATDKIGAGMPADMYEELGDLAEAHQPASKRKQSAS